MQAPIACLAASGAAVAPRHSSHLPVLPLLLVLLQGRAKRFTPQPSHHPCPHLLTHFQHLLFHGSRYMLSVICSNDEAQDFEGLGAALESLTCQCQGHKQLLGISASICYSFLFLQCRSNFQSTLGRKSLVINLEWIAFVSAKSSISLCLLYLFSQKELPTLCSSAYSWLPSRAWMWMQCLWAASFTSGQMQRWISLFLCAQPNNKISTQ